MAKEKQQHLLDANDITLLHAQSLPVWATAVARMHIDRADMKELGLTKAKKRDEKDETIGDKFPLFHQTLINNIAVGLVAAKQKRELT